MTGSTEKEHVEYRVPRDWVVKSDAELDKMKMFVDGDAKDDDVVNLKSLSVNSGSASSTGANDVVVKTEPQSADSKVKDRVLAFLADPGSALSTLQEMSIQNKLIAPQASQLKYAMELSKDIAKNAARFFHMFVALDVDVFPGNGSLIGLRYLSNINRYWVHLDMCFCLKRESYNISNVALFAFVYVSCLYTCPLRLTTTWYYSLVARFAL